MAVARHMERDAFVGRLLRLAGRASGNGTPLAHMRDDLEALLHIYGLACEAEADGSQGQSASPEPHQASAAEPRTASAPPVERQAEKVARPALATQQPRRRLYAVSRINPRRNQAGSVDTSWAQLASGGAA
jgi:hypothetical protein